MDGHCSSPEPNFESPPQNTSTPAPARRDNSDDGTGSEESIRDEEESLEHSEDDLDEYFKNAEGLSDQTFGDMRLYDYSLSTDVEKSISHSFHRTLNESSTSNRHYNDLSCSMLCDGEKSLQSWPEKICEIAYLDKTSAKDGSVDEDSANLLKLLRDQLDKVKEENKHLKQKNVELLEERTKQDNALIDTSNVLVAKVRSANDTLHIHQLSVCSLEHRNDYSLNNTSDSFQLDSFIKQPDSEDVHQEHIIPEPSFQNNADVIPVTKNTLHCLCQAVNAVKGEVDMVKQSTKKVLFEGSKELKIFDSALKELIKRHNNELSTLKTKMSTDHKHYQETTNTLKDDIKTYKMRYQELMKKHKDQEMRDLKSRLPETEENLEGGGETDANVPANAVEPHSTFDDSFGSCNSNLEETFTNLTRTKVEYLKLTPSEYVDDEVIDTVHIPDAIRHLIDDKNLKYKDLEKKFEANKRYLEDMTHEREAERDEFQQQLEEQLNQIEDLKKESSKYMEEKKQLIYQIEDLATRLKNSEENEIEITQKLEKTDGEAAAAVEKISELREIIREQETRIDEITQCLSQLEEEKQVLKEENAELKLMCKKEQPIFKEQDTYGTLPMDVTDEIHQQLQELWRRVQFKVTEKDSMQMHTRPGSSCSGVASAISTEDISCREVAGRALDSFSYEHMGSTILNMIHRLGTDFDNLIRYDDVFFKKLRDTELQTMGQRTKIEELESQIAGYQEKCSKQTLQIADLEGKVDALRFESSNQELISSLKARLSTALKQLDDMRILMASKEKELTQARAEFNNLRAKLLERHVEKKEAFSQTYPRFEDTISNSDLMYDGVSPEKIRRMDTINPMNVSVLSLPRNSAKDSQAMVMEPEISVLDSLIDTGRAGRGASFASGDSCANESSVGEITIKEQDDNLQQLQQLLLEKDKEIQTLKEKLKATVQRAEVQEKGVDNISQKSNNCEQESVILETDLNPNQSKSNVGEELQIARVPGSDGDYSSYEISYSHDYEVDGDLLKYLGTKLLYQGPRPDMTGDQGERRLLETDKQIEIATLNTHILQLKRALEDEKKRSDDLLKRLRVCEEDKAAMRSRSPLTRGPVHGITSSVSVQQMQQKELARQVEEGRKILKEKDKEIRNLRNKVSDLEAQLNSKGKNEQELMTRLNNTIAMLKRCEDHGRELTASNQEQVHEIRRLRNQLDRANVNRNTENYLQPQGSGNEYFENFMRAKSHRKALAWQKKYLTSVVLGYKSILRQNGHGNEHPDLLQTQIPIAPGAVGYLDTQSPRTRFRVGVLTVMATLRMKYMVSRWCKKRPGESSPDSEYKVSRHSTKVDTSIVRPRKTALHTRINSATNPPRVDNNVNVHDIRRGNLGDISEYFSRFSSIEKQISSSLSRNLRPSK